MSGGEKEKGEGLQEEEEEESEESEESESEEEKKKEGLVSLKVLCVRRVSLNIVAGIEKATKRWLRDVVEPWAYASVETLLMLAHWYRLTDQSLGLLPFNLEEARLVRAWVLVTDRFVLKQVAQVEVDDARFEIERNVALWRGGAFSRAFVGLQWRA
jgi:hypothetical protein